MVVIPFIIYLGSVLKIYSYDVGLILLFLWLICIITKSLFIKNKIIINKGKNNTYLLLFIFIGLIYVFLSFIGFIEIFNIDNFVLEIKYIIRHSVFIFALALVVILNKFNTKLIFTNKHLKLLNILTAIGYIFYLIRNNVVDVNQNLFLLLMLYINLSKKRNKILYCLTIIILFLPTTIDGSTTMLISRMFFILFLSIRNFKIQKKIVILYILLVTFLILALPVINSYFSLISFKDANSMWRYNFWTTEINLLKEINFIGVGFGTPYVAPEFMKYVSSISGPFATTVNHSSYDMMYIIAQHSSIVNIFYRMGIIGIILFVVFHVSIIKSLSKGINNSGSIFLFYFLLNLCTIFFNAGLESPKYLLGYMISLFLLTYIDNNLKKIDKNNWI